MSSSKFSSFSKRFPNLKPALNQYYRLNPRALAVDSPHCRLFSVSTATAFKHSSVSAVDKSYPPENATVASKHAFFAPLDSFARRHLGPREAEIPEMLKTVGVSSIDEMVNKVIPSHILAKHNLIIENGGLSEQEMLSYLKSIAKQNKVYKSYIGMGFNDTIMPPVIQRNILENPGWYTQYTPYQPEISQGRLESLLNFQTAVQDFTGMPIANASLLDEGTAAGEALAVCVSSSKKKSNLYFFVDENCHPHTVAVVKTRASGLNVSVIVGNFESFDFNSSHGNLIGALVSYPDTFGNISNFKQFADQVHSNGAQFVVSADIMALAVLEPPSTFGADIVVGNTQRFGVPLGYGGPHAAYFATTEANRRRIPGRIIGVSKDSKGRQAYRLALQTREQHIRREKATSNICTAQALLANIASMYAVYHGPQGIKDIANRIHRYTAVLASVLQGAGYKVENTSFFDTIKVNVNPEDSAQVIQRAANIGINFRQIGNDHVGISIGESVTLEDLGAIVSVFKTDLNNIDTLVQNLPLDTSSSKFIPSELIRKSPFLTHPIFSKYHSETEMLRYLTQLQNKDLSLANALIPLGSCTMKLNATSQMIPITWPEFSDIHPFAPKDQALGYKKLIHEIELDLARITGMDGTSVQPNSGAQGEYTGLRVIKKYHESIGEGHRNICLIPVSAHGTNPASAMMANLKVVTVKCESNGYLDIDDLKLKIQKHAANLSSVMITYPSTFGIFEEKIIEITNLVHENGGQVYMDGANMNAQIGLMNPGEIGADVCHLNLHKSFCIPHGGGGPGVGPICVKKHLIPFLPTDSLMESNLDAVANQSVGPSTSAPYGSAGILPISWAYIKLMGGAGLRKSTEVAILNANYMMRRLESHYLVQYTNSNNMCAHEFILDLHEFSKSAGVSVVDIAKRLQDYGIHPPTMSWPVPNGLMIEPTESESLFEIDRFCDAMIQIRNEIRDIEQGKYPRDNNLLVNSPHSLEDIASDTWNHPYSREQAAYPLKSLRARKFWPTISRIDDTYGDTNFKKSISNDSGKKSTTKTKAEATKSSTSAHIQVINTEVALSNTAELMMQQNNIDEMEVELFLNEVKQEMTAEIASNPESAGLNTPQIINITGDLADCTTSVATDTVHATVNTASTVVYNGQSSKGDTGHEKIEVVSSPAIK
ncbi:hypothetical protein BB560_003920, partial [Smittium megazygosporum]